ncbi:flavoprotein [Thalassobacillus pellis]|uniref:flavoprotein n=1 Tax=Thalassobacillus pellis TaxID=748008 RepID=UPI001960EA82|nr:flavoprotein [Thalassobacillus pellis]MBM7552573.1 hypothetical protein [Thalassobacillus pellis]
MEDYAKFHESFLTMWRNSSLQGFKETISEDYQAREVRNGQIVDFGYKESLEGWEQGFKFVRENEAHWEIEEVALIPIQEDEFMSILTATLRIKGNIMKTGNLFFETFKLDHKRNWKLVRSYIEAGIALDKTRNLQFT